ADTDRHTIAALCRQTERHTAVFITVAAPLHLNPPFIRQPRHEQLTTITHDAAGSLLSVFPGSHVQYRHGSKRYRFTPPGQIHHRLTPHLSTLVRHHHCPAGRHHTG